ncbi:signal recognition particle 14 kda [Lynx pardinus]|nr:signal recognition particle 14 kda [Lynx pardinus]
MKSTCLVTIAAPAFLSYNGWPPLHVRASPSTVHQILIPSFLQNFAPNHPSPTCAPQLPLSIRSFPSGGASCAGMVLLESEQFLTELTRLFQKCRLSGSVFITLKKYDGRTKPIPRKGSVEGFEPSDNKCLLRATDGKKKISTVVSSKEVNKFQMAYSNLLRANMDGLKKRDKKSKSKKSKAAQ